MKLFNDKKIADKFREEEVDGPSLLSERILKEESMKELNLKTIGKRSNFEEAVQKLRGLFRMNHLLESFSIRVLLISKCNIFMKYDYSNMKIYLFITISIIFLLLCSIQCD